MALAAPAVSIAFMDNIVSHFSTYIPVSDDLERELTVRLKPQSFKTGTLVHHAKDICVESSFIRKGILRLYYLKDGKEVSEYFCGEGEWVNSPRSFMFQKVDNYYIDVLENSEVLTLHLRDLRFLFDNFPEMERYSRLSMGTMLYQLIERVHSFQCRNAFEKYEHFCQVYKNIHSRLPLGMIASYLGITPETLSRVRAKRKN